MKALRGNFGSLFLNALLLSGAMFAQTPEVKTHEGRLQGVAADGTPTTAVNILYKADDNVVSWQSTRRFLGDTPLPDVKEIAIERVQAGK